MQNTKQIILILYLDLNLLCTSVITSTIVKRWLSLWFRTFWIFFYFLASRSRVCLCGGNIPAIGNSGNPGPFSLPGSSLTKLELQLSILQNEIGSHPFHLHCFNIDIVCRHQKIKSGHQKNTHLLNSKEFCYINISSWLTSSDQSIL